MCRFSGNMDVKVDGKGRLFVPAAFRRALEGDSTLFFEFRKGRINFRGSIE